LLNDAIYTFSGGSGEGKSTIVSIIATEGGTVINDELNIVELQGEKVILHSTPFKGDHIPSNVSDAIRNLVFIRKSKVNRIRKLSKPASFRKMLRHEYVTSFKECHVSLDKKKATEVIFNVCDRISCYELYFKKDNSFVSLLPNG
jgi:dephospho-CoA kinase